MHVLQLIILSWTMTMAAYQGIWKDCGYFLEHDRREMLTSKSSGGDESSISNLRRRFSKLAVKNQ
jgi:hypothetical protein